LQTNFHERGIVLDILLYLLLKIVCLGPQFLDDLLLVGDQRGGAMAYRLRHRVERQRRRDNKRENDQAEQSKEHIRFEHSRTARRI
jgi:hypothetical protein